ncbi:hypothetical protein OU581_02815 [Escherichia coli]|nr:hypothetical protein [Escherichia coli]MDF8647143.1 hypothetical protein [Escherichia coli]
MTAILRRRNKTLFTDTSGMEYEVESSVIATITRCPAGDELIYVHLTDGSQITVLTESWRELEIISEVRT